MDKIKQLQERKAALAKASASVRESIATLFDESSCNEQLKFERGFRLGVLITSEIFYAQDTFL